MEKFLISVDLDDTLLTQEKTITDESVAYIQELERKGHHFIINTGRPHQGAVEYLKRLNIHEPMIVNNGGAIVYYDESYDKVIDYFTFEMDMKTVISFNEKVKHMLHTGTVSSVFKFYTYDLSKTPFWVIHKSKDVEIVEGDISKTLSSKPHMSEYYVKKEFEKEFEEVLSQEEFKDFHVTKWGLFDDVISYEISSSSTDKGKAMEFLSKKFNIPLENTISFGDQLNDLPMIEKAHYGVAMINARNEVKEKAKYISEFDFNNNGVISFVKKVIR